MDLEKELHRCCNCGEKFLSVDEARKHTNKWFERGNPHNVENITKCIGCNACDHEFSKNKGE